MFSSCKKKKKKKTEEKLVRKVSLPFTLSMIQMCVMHAKILEQEKESFDRDLKNLLIELQTFIFP